MTGTKTALSFSITGPTLAERFLAIVDKKTERPTSDQRETIVREVLAHIGIVVTGLKIEKFIATGREFIAQDETRPYQYVVNKDSRYVIESPSRPQVEIIHLFEDLWQMAQRLLRELTVYPRLKPNEVLQKMTDELTRIAFFSPIRLSEYGDYLFDRPVYGSKPMGYTDGKTKELDHLTDATAIKPTKQSLHGPLCGGVIEVITILPTHVAVTCHHCHYRVCIPTVTTYGELRGVLAEMFPSA